VEERTEALILDAATRRNLELDVSMSGNPDATLFALIDQCVTSMGSRQLRRWLNRPLTDQPTLRSRYHALGALIYARRFEGVREHLQGIGDIERILARVALRSARPRDLTQLRTSLALLPALRSNLAAIDSPLLQELRARIDEHDDVVKLLTAAIAQEPGTFVRDGDVIAEGYDPDLDELRKIATHTDEFLLELERRERERTGIAGLKLGYNRVSGFFIEITRKDAERCRKITSAANSQVGRALRHGRAQRVRRQGTERARPLARPRKRALREPPDSLIDRLGPLQASGMALSELDALASMSERACTLEWTHPELVSESRLTIECGRHPSCKSLLYSHTKRRETGLEREMQMRESGARNLDGPVRDSGTRARGGSISGCRPALNIDARAFELRQGHAAKPAMGRAIDEVECRRALVELFFAGERESRAASTLSSNPLELRSVDEALGDLNCFGADVIFRHPLRILAGESR